MSTLHAKLLFSGARALYLGPSFGLSAHRNAVAVLCAGIDGSFGVADDPLRPAAGYVRCTTALIPANTLHRLDIGAVTMAFLYLDSQCADLPVLRAAMHNDHRRFFTGLANEARAVAAFGAIAAGEMSARSARFAVDKALDLTPPASGNERIAAALRCMREEPGAAHSLRELAAASALSPSRFLHLFKESTGVPLRRYRIWNRMGVAVRHIGAGASLTYAALEAGFSSSAHFSAAFRAMFGMRPSRLVEARLTLLSSKAGTSEP